MRPHRLATLGLLLVVACVSTPISGRSNIPVLLSPETEVQIGEEAYQEYLAGTNEVGGAQGQMVERVMGRLVAALGDDDPGYPWEVKLIRDDATVNAWCLPGGKMAVYTGILPVTQDETGLAVVMGHEIAHAVAQHGARRMQAALGKDYVLDLAANWKPDLAQYAGVADTVIQYGVLMPFGRADELEADQIGLILMARAGYDPRAAVPFWQRMASLGSGSTPVWLSTHPSNDQRIDRLQEMMPEAVAVYQQATGRP
jgi:predicted Zn-dependent protease